MVTNILLRLVHVEMLSSFQVKDILEFVKSFHKFDSADWDQVWFEDGMLPIFTHRVWLDTLVRWLYVRQESPSKFIDNMMAHITKGEFFPSRPILRTYLPYVSNFYATDDTRKLCLEILPKRQVFLKGANIIPGKVENGMRTDFVEIAYKDEERPATNYMPWINTIIRYAPVFFGMPMYEDVKLCASQNSVTTALEGRANASIENDQIFVNGEVIGKIVSFADCLNVLGLTASESEYESKMECVLVEKEFRDPKTDNVLLHAGCYYGTPRNISAVTYKEGLKVEDPFAKLMTSVVRQEFEVWKPLQRAHENLLAAMNDSVHVVYYKSDDSISVNSKHLMRNVPARILRNILREYTETGREEYENREFKRDPEICLDPIRPNFESRLNRVVSHLERVSQYFEIVRHRRGGFRFVPKCRIDFHEE